MRTSSFLGCMAVALLLWPSFALLADQPRIADNVSFQVPLADGSPGTALLLAAREGQVMIVAKDGSPPVLALYSVVPGSSPQPGPQPGPEPGPQPDPQPQPQGPLNLIWIEESADRTAEQARAITDPDIREALRKSAWTLRVADDDVVDENGWVPSDLQQFIASARRDGLPRLFAVNTQGAEVFAGKAPNNVAEFKALLKRLGLPIAVDAEPQEEPGAQNLGTDAQLLGGNSQASRDDAQKIGTSAQKLGTDACPTGKCLTAPGSRRAIMFK